MSDVISRAEAYLQSEVTTVKTDIDSLEIDVDSLENKEIDTITYADNNGKLEVEKIKGQTISVDELNTLLQPIEMMQLILLM